MQKYQDLSGEIQKIKMPIKIMVISGIVINLLIGILFLWINFYWSKTEHFGSVEACLKGMESLVNNTSDPKIINEKVIDDIQKHQIKFNVERIHLVKYLDGLNCDVITKDSDGFRSYQVSLEKSLRFDHLFKITDVKEQPIISEYQR